ncbi:hypothetical protein IV500_04365 [Paeniglutamicibacter antarcticus]|uniref:Uncharacterized protein n=1 Tax=Arthrobacter terrae TaxID=2935737 RepID=A0A931CPK1_9MICC|nr:hypothetical protein [Arthrobacter terrae]MBG0738654.1 hypothetical protein [Arthrobacter terrae]
MTSAPKITVEHLIKKGLLHPDAANKHRGKHERFNRILRSEGRVATEAQVTGFMTMFGGDLEDAVIGYLCTAAGVEDRDRLQIVSGLEFRFDSEAPNKRSIDLVIGRRDEDAPTTKGAKSWTPVVAVEAKFGAMVNGGHGYCPDDALGYSNQAICYALHTCVDDRLDGTVKYVWLGNPVDAEMLALYGPWGRKGIHRGDFDYQTVKDAFDDQELAKDKWKPATWPALGAAITTALNAQGLAAEAEAIVRFLRAGGPSAN